MENAKGSNLKGFNVSVAVPGFQDKTYEETATKIYTAIARAAIRWRKDHKGAIVRDMRIHAARVSVTQ